jgi:uncharacterized protein YbjT (DUF2867 family)
MNIAIFGASGFVGKHLIQRLSKDKTLQIYAGVRHFGLENIEKKNIKFVKIDLLNNENIFNFLKNIDVVIYLIHSLDQKNFVILDKKYADIVSENCKKAKVKKIIYLSGIISKGEILSKHLKSRQETAGILATSKIPTAEIRASIILGKESISYQIIYNISKKLKFIFAPRYINSFCSPIFIDDVIEMIYKIIFFKVKNHQIFEIGSENMRYKDILILCSQLIHKKAIKIFVTPFVCVFISSFLVAKISKLPFQIVQSLIESLKNNTIPQKNIFKDIVGRDPIKIGTALKKMNL